MLIKRDFSALGIENKRLAEVLADICCYHDCRDKTVAELSLRDHAVTPYGVIHAKRLAVLLKFIDELDGAYTRVYPHYLAGEPTDTIEGFRRSTSGVRFELANGTVVTTVDLSKESLTPNVSKLQRSLRQRPRSAAFAISNSDSGLESRYVTWENTLFSLNRKYVSIYLTRALKMEATRLSSITRKWEELAKAFEKLVKNGEVSTSQPHTELGVAPPSMEARFEGKFRELEDQLSELVIGAGGVGNLAFWLGLMPTELYSGRTHGDVPVPRGPFVTEECRDSYLPIPSIPDGVANIGELIPHLILRNLIFPEFRDGQHPKDVSRVLFLVLAGSMRGSARKLATLKTDLGIYGVPAEAWVLEYDEHLFTCAGRETFEAALSHEFLNEVVDRMWTLSSGMFGREPCNYQTLAAKLRVDNVALVRTAVRRIAILSRHMVENICCYTVSFSSNAWRWMPCPLESRGYKHDEQDAEHQLKHGQKWIRNRIKQLAAPHDDC